MISKLQAMADYFLGRSKTLSWRRLAVWLSSIPLLCLGKIDQWVWLTVACAFIGGEVWERVSKPKQLEPPA